MAIALLTSTEWTGISGGSGNTSPAIDTTGAKFLVISVEYYIGGSGFPTSVSDNKGNIWTGLTAHAAGNAGHRFFYSSPTTVGAGHTFTVSGTSFYPHLAVLAYSCTAGFTLGPESENGATGSTSPLSAGSVNPSTSGSLILSGWAGMNNAINPVVGSGLTIRQTDNSLSNFNISGAVADLIQAVAAPINPSWSWSGSDTVAISIAVFKEFGPSISRISQDVVEVLTQPVPVIRASQDSVEVITQVVPVVRVSQDSIEVITQIVSEIRASQYSIEILRTNLPDLAETTQFVIIVS